MAEQIPFGVAQQLISTLGSTALAEIKLAKGAKQELNKLRETVTSIHAVLQDADEQQQKNKLVQQWIRRLREVLYEAEDFLDEAATESLRQKVDARGRLKRETDPAIPKDDIIGRKKDVENIIKLLKQPVDIVAIVGMGGLGKTTLAQKVYNDGWVSSHFTKKIWVCVSEDFNVKTLIKKILKCVTGGEVGDLDLPQLQSRLQEKLEGKKCLFVLDDVWNVSGESWQGLEKHLCSGAHGSKILLTTRNRDVASDMGVGVDTDSLYELKCLSDEESSILFEQKAFKGREDKLSSSGALLEIGKELVIKRCKGVPLAIKTLASAVRCCPDEAHWLSMKESDQLWSQRGRKDVDDSIFPVLMLSYCHLPIYLKQCFSYCSIFPKDKKIYKKLLVRLWMAQGYLHSTDGSDFEEIGNRYFHELLARSFFQDAEQDRSGNIGNVKMHDLIHDLAKMVCEKDCLFFDLDGEKEIDEGVHHVVFDLEVENALSNEVTSFLKLLSKVKAKLRTLAFTVHGRHREKVDLKFPVSDFSNFKCLRVLVLRFSSAELSSSIGKLMHLRCLIIKNSLLRKLPDTICNLLNLQTLELRLCWSLKAIPRNLRKLVSLRHLIVEIEECGCIELGQLVSLRHLGISGPRRLRYMGLGRLTRLRQLTNLFVSVEHRDVLNELNGLNLLKGGLRLQGLENVRDVELEAKQVNLKAKKCLQCLCLDWFYFIHEESSVTSTRVKTDESLLDNLEPHPNLKAMFVNGYLGERFSGWLSCITSLVLLEMFGCYNCKHLPPLDQLKSLKILYLSEMQSLEYVELSSEASSSSAMVTRNCFFPSLEELVLLSCPNFRGWRRSNDKDEETDVDLELQPCNWFPRLSKLSIRYCPKLSSMPLFPTLEEMLDLRCTSVEPLQQTMEMKITNENAASSSSSFTCLQLSSSPLSKLKRLSLSFLSDLQSVTLSEKGLGALTALESLRIVGCQRLRSLPNSFHHLSSLQRLNISDCEGLSKRCRMGNGPNWWKIQHIPNISTDYEEIGEW